KENKIINESLTTELERYKEQIKLFEERLQFDLIDREKYIDGQLRKVIVDKNAKVADFEHQIHSLKQQFNATVESHKTLSTTVDVLKMESKAKEDKYLDEIVDLEKKNKALDNVIYKMGQSTQTMHMLTKPQVFYNECHKTTLSYQNPLYSSQAQRKVPALYCGHTIVTQHDFLSVIDTEETLEMAEDSRLKMHSKQNDPIAKEKKINIAPIDYVALNKLYDHFAKHFVPQNYPTNDVEDLGKLKPKADIGIFVGYLITMASEQFGSGPELHLITPGTISSGLVQNPPSTTPYVLSTNNWDLLFQPMFDEYYNPPTSVVSLVPTTAAPRPADPTGSSSLTTIDQAAPSTSTSSTTQATQSPITSKFVEEQLQPA
ncbi:hypothetical protein Tco_0145244, partial [Tanacetum coccineum]